MKLVDPNKELYSIQSVLGPRDSFRSYLVPNLKNDVGRILIQSIEDYFPSTIESKKYY